MSIDGLYESSIEHFYSFADKLRTQIWNGMELSPVCIFRTNGPVLLYNHPNPPQSFQKIDERLYLGKHEDFQLFGSTQMEINGAKTAIADYGSMDIASQAEVYAELFHEMHHVYQSLYLTHLGSDNPAILLSYPEDYVNDGIKNYEQQTLFKMCFEQGSERFPALLNQFFSSRLRRKQLIGTYLDYEESVESFEGPAFFCECMFYDHYASSDKVLKENHIHKKYFGILTNPYYGRDKLRQRHLASGMAMCYILDKYFTNWQGEYYAQKQTLYSYFMSRFQPQREELHIDSFFLSSSKFHTQQVIITHQLAYEKFLNQPGIKVSLEFEEPPTFEGFDPMNAESINEKIILHSTILKLSKGDENKLFIKNSKVVTLIENELWFVKELILFVPENAINIQSNRLTIDQEGKSISWMGRLKEKSEQGLRFLGE